KPSSTNIFSTVSTPAKARSTNLVNIVSLPVSTASPYEGLSLSDPTNSEEDDSDIPPLEDIYQNSTDGIFTTSSFDDEGAVADFTNMETVVNVSPIPTSRIHSTHPKVLILGDPNSAVQTRSKVNKSSGAHAFISYKISEALEDESWVAAIGTSGLSNKMIKEELLSEVKQGLSNVDVKMSSFMAKVMKENRYRRGTIDKTLFLKKDKHDIILVQVYVDDIIFGSTKKSWCDEFEALMKSRFQMSSMGELTFFLGLQVKQKPDGIFISQDKYVAEILKKFDFANVKTASTPIETQKPLVKDEEANDVDVHLYRSMIGSLMYLTASRPDIMFAVCACSRFQVTPKTSHLSVVKRILGNTKQELSNSWQETHFFGNGQGSQTIVSYFYTEAEYVVAASCCGQVLWIQNQMLDYGFNFMNTKIYIDNESTICIVKNPVYHSKTKHIAIRHHFIRYAYEKKLIQVLKIHTDDNVADLLTNAFDVSSKMVVLDSCPKHNMVAYLEKSEGNAEFHEIIDFLKRSSIHHALTVSPVVSTTFVEQFWTSAKSKTINNVRHITAKVAGKSVSISEASIRSDLLFDDADGIDSLPNQTIFDAIQQMGSKSTSWDQIPTNIATAHTSSRPSPTTTIPDSIPETSGENLGGHYQFPRKSFSKKHRVHKESVSKQGRKFAKGESSVQRDPLFDEVPEITVDQHGHRDCSRCREDKGEIGDEDKEIEGECTDEQVEGTEEPNEGTEEQIEDTVKNFEGTEENIKGTEEKVESTDGHKKAKLKKLTRPKPTSTRSLLTLKPLPKINPKKGKKKIEEEDESESESDGIPQAEKKFKHLESDEELARKMQEEWEEEEERNRVAEEQVANEALIRNFDDIKARIEADRLLAEKL
ncbi:putative ribonuclease H-like domain-containing protein, partial [Tanacetum coccineum]